MKDLKMRSEIVLKETKQKSFSGLGVLKQKAIEINNG